MNAEQKHEDVTAVEQSLDGQEIKKVEEVRYFYLKDKAKFPVACVASLYDEEQELIKYAVSTHNPADDFDRKIARDTALDRIKKGKFGYIPLPKGEKRTEVKWHIIYQILENKLFKTASPLKKKDWRRHIPERTTKAALLWLKQKQAEERKKHEESHVDVEVSTDNIEVIKQ